MNKKHVKTLIILTLTIAKKHFQEAHLKVSVCVCARVCVCACVIQKSFFARMDDLRMEDLRADRITRVSTRG